MKPTNVLFIWSDEHQHDLMGCAGHPFIHTPNLDALAARDAKAAEAAMKEHITSSYNHLLCPKNALEGVL